MTAKVVIRSRVLDARQLHTEKSRILNPRPTTFQLDQNKSSADEAFKRISFSDVYNQYVYSTTEVDLDYYVYSHIVGED